MIIYKVCFEPLIEDSDVGDTFLAVENEVCNDSEYKYHTDNPKKQDEILHNAFELLEQYALGRYLLPTVEPFEIEE
jgi:hypothetical protein